LRSIFVVRCPEQLGYFSPIYREYIENSLAAPGWRGGFTWTVAGNMPYIEGVAAPRCVHQVKNSQAWTRLQ
jgi:hypothetical protein